MRNTLVYIIKLCSNLVIEFVTLEFVPIWTTMTDDTIWTIMIRRIHIMLVLDKKWMITKSFMTICGYKTFGTLSKMRIHITAVIKFKIV